MAPIALETEVGGFFFEMPLARHGGEVTGVTKDFGRGHGMGEGDVSRCDAVLSG